MDNRPHYIWALVVVIIVAVLAWIYSINRPDVNNYGKGSMPVANDIKHFSFVDVNPCGILFKLDSDKPFKLGKNVQNNSIVNTIHP